MTNKCCETKTTIHLPLRSKLLLLFIPLLIITLSLTIFIVERQMRTSIQKEFISRGTSIGRNLAAGNANYLITYNYVVLDQTIEKTVRENSLSYAMIRLFDGEVVAYSGDPKFKAEIKKVAPPLEHLKQNSPLTDLKVIGQDKESILTIDIPILIQDRIWGGISIGLSFESITASIEETRFLLISLGVIIAIVSCILSILLSNRMTRHLSFLVNDVEEVSKGNYDKTIHISTNDEIGYLANRFTIMKENLKDHINLLQNSNTELENTNNKLHNLFLSTQSMNPIEDRKKLYSVILDSAMTAVNSEGASLLIVKPNKKDEVAALKINSTAALEDHETITKFLETRSLINSTDYFLKKDMGSFQVQYESIESTPIVKTILTGCSQFEMVSIPLCQKDELFGMINIVLRNDQLIHAFDITVLNVLANHISITLKRNSLHSELEEAYLSSIQSLVKTLELKDEYTHGHAERVTKMCMLIGKQMGMGADSLNTLLNAAMLHDIGKIGITDTVLNKKAKLDDSEWNLIKRHTEFGDEILRPISFLKDARRIVRHHHEREDGKGYPDKLNGSDLSLSEKIIIVADSFDAMNSKRSYRNVMDREYIRNEFLNNKGKQFDADVVDVFLEIYDNLTDIHSEEISSMKTQSSKLIVFPNTITN